MPINLQGVVFGELGALEKVRQRRFAVLWFCACGRFCRNGLGLGMVGIMLPRYWLLCDTRDRRRGTPIMGVGFAGLQMYLCVSREMMMTEVGKTIRESKMVGNTKIGN